MIRRAALVVTIIFVFENPGATAQAVESTAPQILLAMCDKVGLTDAAMEQVMASASAILNETGARTTWIRSKSASTATTFDYDSFENCEIPSNDYILVVITGDEPKGHSFDLMGLAPRTNVFQRRTYILHSRVKAFVREHRPRTRHDADSAILLGSVIAHEVGHLLLPGKKHALSGLMRNDWGYREAAEAAAGRLGFTGDELVAIREYLSGRTRRDADKSRATSGMLETF